MNKSIDLALITLGVLFITSCGRPVQQAPAKPEPVAVVSEEEKRRILIGDMAARAKGFNERMTECSACWQAISNEAKACPKCGHPNYRLDYDWQPPAPSTNWSSKAPLLQAVSTDKQAVFFECRSNEVFAIDLGSLQNQIEVLLKRVGRPTKETMPQFLKAIQEPQITNAYYKVNATYLLAGLVALEPNSAAPGETMGSLVEPNGTFQRILSQLNPEKQYVAFLVRNDSSAAFHLAQGIAEAHGLDVGWEALPDKYPIKFGASGKSVKVQKQP